LEMNVSDPGIELSSGRTWRDRWEVIAPRIPKRPGVALDIGAAGGIIALQLAELGWTVYAVDQDPNHREHENIRWTTAALDARTIGTFPYRVHVDKFDLVLGLSVLHWMDDWGAAYWAMRHIARQVVIEVPHPLEHRGDPEKERRFKWLDHLATSSGYNQASAYGWDSDYRRTLVFAEDGWPEGAPATVHTGRGAGVDLIPTIPGLADALGYEPYPGTIDHHLGRWFELKEAPIRIEAPDGEWSFWPVDYMGLPGHICGHPGWEAKGRAIDFVGPVNFREVFGLRDSDTAWFRRTT
jgi:SAM-dependent methyltransferase